VDDLPAAPAVALPSAAPTGSTRAPGPNGEVNAERLVLDEARTAFTRGDPEAALRAVEAHERAHPSGQLTEEREALAVRTLVALGRISAARERGARFAARYPGSMMLPAVEAALGATGPAPSAPRP